MLVSLGPQGRFPTPQVAYPVKMYSFNSARHARPDMGLWWVRAAQHPADPGKETNDESIGCHAR